MKITFQLLPTLEVSVVPAV